MYDTIRQPCHDAEECTGVCGENVAKVGAVENILKGWENTDPYWRSPAAWNKAI